MKLIGLLIVLFLTSCSAPPVLEEKVCDAVAYGDVIYVTVVNHDGSHKIMIANDSVCIEVGPEVHYVEVIASGLNSMVKPGSLRVMKGMDPIQNEDLRCFFEMY